MGLGAMPIASIEADRLEPDGPRGRPNQNAPLIDVDRLERRYRLVYPLKIFLENARQVVVASATVLIVGATMYFLQYAVSSTNEKAPIEIQVFLVTALSSLVVVGYIALWGLTVRNFWKLGSLLTLILALVLGWSLYETGTDVASPTIEVTTRLMAAAPMSAVLLLTAIALTGAYYAHVIWALLEAAFGVALVAPLDRVIIRDRPPREVSRPGIFSRFWAFPPLFKFARTSFWRYAAIIMLSLTSALLFSVAALLPVIMKGPIEDIPDLVEKCPTEVNCLQPKVATLLDFFFFPFAGLLVCLVVGWLAQRLLRRLLRFSLETLQEIDPRPPVLFLRAFRDDQVPLRAPKIALFGRLLEIGRRSNSLDQLLLEEATPSGPVVGLGSPTDKRPPLWRSPRLFHRRDLAGGGGKSRGKLGLHRDLHRRHCGRVVGGRAARPPPPRQDPVPDPSALRGRSREQAHTRAHRAASSRWPRDGGAARRGANRAWVRGAEGHRVLPQ